MSTVAEIEAAIKKLPASEIEELAGWLEAFRQRQSAPATVEAWLDKARGRAVQGVTTAQVMALTREDG